MKRRDFIKLATTAGVGILSVPNLILKKPETGTPWEDVDMGRVYDLARQMYEDAKVLPSRTAKVVFNGVTYGAPLFWSTSPDSEAMVNDAKLRLGLGAIYGTKSFEKYGIDYRMKGLQEIYKHFPDNGQYFKLVITRHHQSYHSGSDVYRQVTGGFVTIDQTAEKLDDFEGGYYGEV